MVGAGIDSQPLLSIDPTQRIQPDAKANPARGLGLPPIIPPGQEPDGADPIDDLGASPFLHAELHAGVQLGQRWHVGSDLMLQGRTYGSAADRADARAGVFAGLAADSLIARLHLEGGRFATVFGRDDAWYAGPRLRTLYALSPRLWLGAEANATWRAYDANLALEDNPSLYQQDWRYGAGVDLGWWGDAWNVGVGLLVDRVDSNVREVRRNELFPWVGAGWPQARWRLYARYGPVVRQFDGAVRNGVEHLVRVQAQHDLTRALSLYARADYGLAHGASEALDYQRVEVMAGISLALGFGAATPAVPQEDAGLALTQGPATLREDGVHFEVVIPGAGEVSVIGTFNDWDAAAGSLTPRGDGRFEGTLQVAPGKHRYQLLVDGVPQTPPDAPGYVDDGFGGRDAVLKVDAD
jgi:hypothetical protein